MSEKKLPPTTAKLKHVRLSFPALFVPEKFEETSAPRYGCALLIPKSDPQVKLVQAAIAAAGRAKFGEKWGEPAFRKTVKMHAFRDGDEKEYDGYADHWFISANRSAKQGRPVVVDKAKRPLTADDGIPYGGCYVHAVVDFYADTRYGKAINAALIAVQFSADGEAFAGGTRYDDDMFDDESDGDDPSAAATERNPVVDDAAEDDDMFA